MSKPEEARNSRKMLMRVTRTNVKITSIPDYYGLYIKWRIRADKSGRNEDIQESYRLARLAEEFGLAIIEEDTTQEFFLVPF